jgi:UDP-N-acetylmuramoyl-tripeptide--D-alanyl-D-alanine ligase
MKHWTAQHVATAAGGQLSARSEPDRGPQTVTIDSREAGPGALFVGLAGSVHEGGTFAAEALRQGAWGAIVDPAHRSAAESAGSGVVIEVADPLAALQRMATAWRRELGQAGARVIGVTGSTGKTSTKDLLRTLLAPHRRTVASRANFNTEIGVPLEILAAPAGTEVLVLEMAMRGAGQIAELAGIAEPDVGVIVSIGPVHLELLGSIENVAAAKAELIAGLTPEATAIVPAGEHLLDPHLRADVRTLTFGNGGDVHYQDQTEERVRIDGAGVEIELAVDFSQAHLRTDLLAAVAACLAIAVTPTGPVELVLTAGRGEYVTLPGGVTIIDGCYNANPMSMRAALADLAAAGERINAGRRVAVLGDMLELGSDARAYHEEIGALAQDSGVDLLVTVGPLAAHIADRFDGEAQVLADAGEAAAIVPELLEPDDVVLVKGSLGVGLKLVCDALLEGARA